jgi:membrane-bound lytic murein transglycosylase B
MRFFLLTILFFWFYTLFPLASAGTPPADLVKDGEKINITSPEYADFFRELETVHHFNRDELLSLFKDVSINRKVLQLMDQQWEGKPYYKYWPLFITSSVVAKGKKELLKHRELFDRIEEKFGVDREVIVAIWGIESRFGTNTGGYNLFRSLNTLFAAYPRRSDFFRKELIHFLLLCRENNLDPLSIKGSYAGAFGQAQFMPSSYNEYGVDFDGDSRRDLISSPEDIFASIANYLKRFNWVLHAPLFAEIGNKLKDDILVAAYKKGRKSRVDWRLVARVQKRKIPRPQKNGRLSIIGLEKSPFFGGGTRFVAGYPNLHAITEYNHSNKYAMAVAEMAIAFKEKP